MNTEHFEGILRWRTTLQWSGVVVLTWLLALRAWSAECNGVAVWQESLETNRLRCGVPGLLSKSKYYAIRIDRETIWKTPTNGLTAKQIVENQTKFAEVRDKPCEFDGVACPMVSTNSWSVEIPFPVAADLSATEGGFCDDVFQLEDGCDCVSGSPDRNCQDAHECGNLCKTAFNQIQTSCCVAGNPAELPGTIRTNAYVSTDDTYVLDTTKTFASGLGTQRVRRESYLQFPSKIDDLVEQVLEAARKSPWYDGKLFLNSVRGDFNLQCVFANLLRYRIKFPSRVGVLYTVKWDLQLIRHHPTAETNLLTGFSWSGVGNGSTQYTDFFYLPAPELWETYDGEVVNIRIESEEGCVGGGCQGDDDMPGDGRDFLNSAGFFISLGAGTIDGTAGVIRFHEERPSAAMTTPAALRFELDSRVVRVRTNDHGEIHLAAPTVLVRIVPESERGYWMHCSSAGGGEYATNRPFLSHQIVSPGPANAGPPHRLQHIRYRHSSGKAVTNEFSFESPEPNSSAWRLVSGNGLKGERLIKTWINEQLRAESYRRFDPASGRELTRRDDLYRVADGREWLLSRTTDPAGLALMTTNSYDPDGRLRRTVHADGSWERREYHPSGWLARLVQPFTNQPPDAAEEECRVTAYDYIAIPGSPDAAAIDPWRPRVVRESIRGDVVRTTLYAYPNENTVLMRLAASPEWPDWNDSGNEITRTQYDAQRRVSFVESNDGTRTSATYEPDGAGQTITRRHFDTALVEFGRFEERTDRLGRVVYRRTYESGLLVEEEIHSHPDEFGRPTRVDYLDGSASTQTRQDCCNLSSLTDRDGSVTRHEYDALRRLVASTRNGVTESNIFDAADRVTAAFRHAISGPPLLRRGLEYDAASRVVRETNAMGHVTQYSHARDVDGSSLTIMENPDGGLRVERRHRDGSLASVTGSAAFPVGYTYGVGVEDGSPRSYTIETKLDLGGQETTEWIQTYRDAAGRAYKIAYPGADRPYSQSYFNAFGQIWKERDPDGVVTLFEHNARGEREIICLDENGNDQIEYDGSDRITRVITDLTEGHGTQVRRTRTYAWETVGQAAPTLIQTVEESIDGLQQWRNDSGRMTSSKRTLPVQGSYSIRETEPGGAYTVQQFGEGRLLSVSRFGSNGVFLARTTFNYDLYGRRRSADESSSGVTRYQFDAADRIVRVTTPSPGVPGGPAQTTVTQYDAMGRATNIVQPDGSRTSRAFSQRGELLRTSGAGTYPTAYTYDAQGRLTQMLHWTDFGAGAEQRVTEWQYDGNRGWLTQKKHENGAGPVFEYTPAGRLSSRRWARGIMTRYYYNQFGEVSRVDYIDGGTPSVVVGFDRRGRMERVVRGTDAWQLFHDAAGRLSSQMGVLGREAGLGVTNVFDQAGRRVQRSTLMGSSPVDSHRYLYDSSGRLLRASDGAYSAAYVYAAANRSPRQIRFEENGATRMTTTREFDLLNRLTSVSSATPAGRAAFSFAYSYNDLNLRTRATLADGSFWLYEYDPLGQVISARRYWPDETPVPGQQFVYDFDDMGNRVAAGVGGDSHGANLRSAAMEANPLSQVTRRDVPSFLDIIGAASAPAEVTVNGQTAERRGEYYRAELRVENGFDALWQPIVCQAVQGAGTTTTAGHLFVPQTPEAFSYDADGNLTGDGRWRYVWDAENRLTEMRTHDTLPPGAKMTVSFAYDFHGRRIRKAVDRWTGETWFRSLHEQYVYDGWNVVVVLNATNRATIRSFLWGADLSGDFEGAGGVGGLLMAREGNAKAHFVAYDGNGNVVGLVDAQRGQPSAQFEYGPFGESIRASGPAATATPFRFSTKFHDDETGLLFYGHRYYSPELGRWLTRDPLGEGAVPAKVLYAYSGNDPVNDFDVDGRVSWVELVESWGKKLAAGLGEHLVHRPTTIEEVHHVKCPADCFEYLRREEKTVRVRAALLSVRFNLGVPKTKRLVDVVLSRYSVKEYGCCRKRECNYPEFTNWVIKNNPPEMSVLPGVGFSRALSLGNMVVFLDGIVRDERSHSSRLRNCITPCNPSARRVTIKVCENGECVQTTSFQ